MIPGSEVRALCESLSDTLTEFGLAASQKSLLWGRTVYPVRFVEPVLVAGPWIKLEVDVPTLPRGVSYLDLQDERLLSVLRARLGRNVETRYEKAVFYPKSEKPNQSLGRDFTFWYFIEVDHNKLRGIPRIVDWRSWVCSDSSRPQINFGLGVVDSVYRDLYSLVGILVGGASRSGKSVFLNNVLCGLSSAYTSKDCKFALIDFKGGVELGEFQDLEHTWGFASTVPELDQLLAFLRAEYESRQKACRGWARNIVEFNRLYPGDRFPWLLVVVDEFAAIVLEMGQKRAVDHFAFLLSRCAGFGIHFIISTQRPSVDVVAGVLKANLPTRVAFSVATDTDSEVILDMPGAERLGAPGRALLVDGCDVIEFQVPLLELEQVRDIVRPFRKFETLQEVLVNA